MAFRVTRWTGTEPPGKAELEEQFFQAGLFPYEWSNDPGDVYPAHVHDYHKVLYVLRGSITWQLPETGEVIETRAGDRIDLPRGTWHAAQVGPAGVACLEGHREE
jgi:quercetin dioxygenase-like cupin family protein